MKKSDFAKFIALLIVLIFINGCSYLSNQNRTVSQKEPIILQEGDHHGIFGTYDLSTSYQYVRQGNNLTLSGTIEPSDSLKYNFNSVEFFDFRVYFSDSAGRILSYKKLFSANHKATIETWTFKRSLMLPNNTYAIVFGYSGKATEGAGSDKVTWDFWLNP